MKCVYCKYLDWTDERYGEYYCTKHGCYVPKGDSCWSGEEED